MRNALLTKVINLYIPLSIVLYLLIFIFWGEQACFFINIVNISVFVGFVLLVLVSYYQKDEFYTKTRLGLTTFVFSMCAVTLYCYMSDYYTGDTFLFSKLDALAYYKMSNGLASSNFTHWYEILTSRGWNFDDWGAPVGMSFFYMIWPSKATLNIGYVVLTSIAAVSMFDMAKTFMIKRYAYMVALTYSVSSYMLFFNGSHLKESFMSFITIESFAFLYKYINEEKVIYLIIALLFSVFMAFFRVPVMGLMWMGGITYLLLRKGSLETYVLVILVLLYIGTVSMSTLMDAWSRYTSDGDITKGENYIGATTFSIYTSIANACIGPFPEMLQVGDKIGYKSLFGSGLYFKMFLALPFWLGFIHCIKEKVIMMYPLFVFTVLEIICISVVNDGIELRKSLPHIPTFILCAFWFMSEYDEGADEEVRKTPYYRKTKFLFNLSVVVLFFATFIWSTYRML